MEAAGSSETPVIILHSTWCHIPEGSMLSADKFLLGIRKCFFYDFLQHDALVCVNSGTSVALKEEVNNDNNNKIGATGIVTRSLRKNVETVPGKHSIDSLQKTAILGTSHIIRKVLQCEA